MQVDFSASELSDTLLLALKLKEVRFTEVHSYLYTYLYTTRDDKF